MGFSKVRFGSEEIFSILVEDVDGRTLEKWKVMKKDFPSVVKILANKFGLKDIKVTNKDRAKDLDWAMK